MAGIVNGLRKVCLARMRWIAGIRPEPRAAGCSRHRVKARPSDAGAPQCRGAAVQHHRGAIASAVEIDRLEILILLQPDAVENVARQDRQAGSLGAERDRLADEILDGLVGTVGAKGQGCDPVALLVPAMWDEELVDLSRPR